MHERKLNIGCAQDDIQEGWINIDKFYYDYPGYPILPADALNLPFKNNVFDYIRMSHFLEHLAITEITPCMLECRRVLKVGGTLEIIVPDLERLATYWIMEKDLRKKYAWWAFAIFGSGRTMHQYHKTGWDASLLKDLFQRFYFTNLQLSHDAQWDFHLIGKATKTGEENVVF